MTTQPEGSKYGVDGSVVQLRIDCTVSIYVAIVVISLHDDTQISLPRTKIAWIDIVCSV